MLPPFIQIFEPTLQAAFQSKCTFKKIETGTIIIDYGQTLTFIPIVLSGSLKVLRLNEDGHELLLYYLTTNESCAMSFTCCMQAKTSSVRALVEEETELMLIPIQMVDHWMSQFPKFRAYIMNTIQGRFDELLKTVDQLAFQRLDERLITYLKSKQTVSGSAVLPLSHQQIAQELATSRVVVSRLLKKLELDGKILLYRNEIKLLSGM